MTDCPDLVGRLGVLRADFEKGRRALADVEREQGQLREKLLRIAGAIEVLEELLTESATGGREP